MSRIVDLSAAIENGVPADPPPLRRASTLWPPGGGLRVTEANGWNSDAPFVHTAWRFAETGDASLVREGHKAGRGIGCCHIEELHDLYTLPASGFRMACFPVKIAKASAGWTRAVAVFDV